MNIKQMRRIDLYAGGVTCLALEVIERLKRVFPSRAQNISEPRKILVTKYLGMGSILLATPMFKALKERFPGCRIVLLTFEGNAGFARQLPLIDEVLSIRTSSFLSFARDLFKALSHIRRERFDVVFDLEFFARFSTIVSYLSGAKMRVGYYLPKLWRGDLLTHQVHFNPYKHVTEVFAAQLKPLDVEITDFTLFRQWSGKIRLKMLPYCLRRRGLWRVNG